MKLENRHLVAVHVAVLLFGLSGLFAKIIPYHAAIIVLGRVFFAAIFLFIIIKILDCSLQLKRRKDIAIFFIIGFILALHWFSFFFSIQLSSVAVGLITFATFPVFSVLLEPIFFKERLRMSNIGVALIVFIGVVLIVENFHFENSVFVGVLWGIVSALTFAVLSIANRHLVKGYSSIVIGFYQNSFAFIVLIPVLFILPFQFQLQNILLLALLGIVFTGVSHVLFINGLKSVTVQRASVIACLEPVYGIVAAIILLSELPAARELLGMVIILTMAVYVTLRK